MIAVDTFDSQHWVAGHFNTEKEAINYANENVKGKEMLKMHVYNDKGEHVYDTGIY